MKSKMPKHLLFKNETRSCNDALEFCIIMLMKYFKNFIILVS